MQFDARSIDGAHNGNRHQEPKRETQNLNDVLSRVAEADVRLIDLQFSDIAGGAKALTIPVELLAVRARRGLSL